MREYNKYDEICYPFMNEEQWFCDYEILTDGLASYLGLALSIAKERDYSEALIKNLHWLTEMALHLNGSLRGKMAIEDEDLQRLYEMYDFYKDQVEIKGFILPTGSYLSSQINISRYKAKEVVRLLNKIDRQQEKVPKILFSFSNLLANLLFILSVYINDVDREENQIFESKSY